MRIKVLSGGRKSIELPLSDAELNFQMKRIVFREGFHLSRIAIPIGILAGAIAGYVLVPQGWNTLMVFVIAAVTALFVYLCVMIAVIKPAKIAAHVTPIEAVRYMAGNNDVMSNSTKVLIP